MGYDHNHDDYINKKGLIVPVGGLALLMLVLGVIVGHSIPRTEHSQPAELIQLDEAKQPKTIECPICGRPAKRYKISQFSNGETYSWYTCRWHKTALEDKTDKLLRTEDWRWAGE